MSENRDLTVLVKANADVADAVLSHSDGGGKLDRGLSDRIAAAHPGVRLKVSHHPSGGFAELRAELESGTSPMIEQSPDIVILSVADDALRPSGDGFGSEQFVNRIRDDLVAAIELIKQHAGAHVLVAGVSTVDPSDQPSNYHDRSEEPFTLRAHRLNLMLVYVSHDEGVSVIDVDRLLAELGAAAGVEAAARYSKDGCERISDEIVRVLDDYGFFDDRPLLAQVGARHTTR